jgi:uncharacterized membrane protein YbhN (UPF0104 family)
LKPRLQAILRLAVSLVLTATLLWLAFRAADSSQVLQLLAKIDPVFFIAAIAAMLSNVAISTVRYRAILSNLSPYRVVRFSPLFQLNLLTLFSAHFLPVGALADGLRAFVSQSILRVPVPAALEGVLADRAFAAAGFAFFGILFLPMQLAWHWPRPAIALQALFFAAIILALSLGVAVSFRLPKLLGPLAMVGQRLAGQIATWPNAALQAGVAATSGVLFAAMILLLGHALRLQISPWIALTVSPAIYLSQVIPVFYAGFGSREVTVAALLVPAGVLNNENAIALALSIGLCNLIASLPGAFFAWALLGPAEVRETRNRAPHIEDR